MEKKGISLIVLVITIIVMIIIAGAIIISLSNSNIINKANEAVSKTNLQNIKNEFATSMLEYKMGNETFPQAVSRISNATIVQGNNSSDYVFLEKEGYKYTLYSTGEVVEGVVDFWDGSIASAFDSGSGSQKDPYVINTASQLAYLASQVNNGTTYEGQYLTLNNSLDLSGKKDADNTWSGNNWVPIGHSYWSGQGEGKDFKGTFNGNNKSIYNIYIKYVSGGVEQIGQGLFGNAGENSNIYNLSVMSGWISGYKGVGGIAGNTNGIVQNCYNKAEVRADVYTGSPNLGGVIGYAADKSKVTNCINDGIVESTSNVNGGTAGIVGAVGTGSTIEKCKNNGTVIGTSSVGGVIGYTGKVNNQPIAIIKNCINNGNIKGKTTAIGGIIGAADVSYVQNCTNNGSVSNIYTNDATTTFVVGGIAGGVTATATIENCINNGSIIAIQQQTGGIVGQNKGTIKGCTNNGTIRINLLPDNQTGGTLAGGICGYFYSGLIENCENKGIVSAAKQSAGGIVGKSVTGIGTIKKSANYAKVYVDYDESVTNSGKYAGGIIGNIGVDGFTIQDVYNSGEVVGIDKIGGIVGGSTKSNVVIKYAYNKGNISSGTENGGVIGGTTVNLSTLPIHTYYLTGTSNIGYGMNVTSTVSDCVGNIEQVSADMTYNEFLTWIETKK